MNVASLANTVYFAVKDDVSACNAIRTELKALAITIATDPASAATVTSATVNGQSFSAQPMMTTGQRLSLLRWVVACIDNNGPISTTQIPVF